MSIIRNRGGNDPRYTGIKVETTQPIPDPDRDNLVEVVATLKEAVETIQGIRGSIRAASPSVSDLEYLGLVTVLDANNYVQSNVITKVEDWHTVGDTGEPALAGSWAHYSVPTGSYRQASFYIDASNIVRLDGLVVDTSGTGGLIFTLPEGYRPDKRVLFGAHCGSGVARVDILVNGEVRHISGTVTSYLSLCGLAFRAARSQTI